MDLQGTTLWWTQNQPQQTMLLVEPIHHPQPQWFNSQTYPNTPHFNTNEENEDKDNTAIKLIEDEKEPMFEKPLTPSDVGKLNRLVIPKQHAEKYFPLGGGDSGECKGLLLSFEDESGKCWRFRYSYWNSSQSYVLTKGWSRYVKDKRLDAGDVVLFERHRVDSQRLFINWRRRKLNGNETAQVSRGKVSDGNGKNEVAVGWSRGFYPAHPYPAHHLLPYQHDHCLHAGLLSHSHQYNLIFFYIHASFYTVNFYILYTNCVIVVAGNFKSWFTF